MRLFVLFVFSISCCLSFLHFTCRIEYFYSLLSWKFYCHCVVFIEIMLCSRSCCCQIKIDYAIGLTMHDKARQWQHIELMRHTGYKFERQFWSFNDWYKESCQIIDGVFDFWSVRIMLKTPTISTIYSYVKHIHYAHLMMVNSSCVLI